MLSVRDIQGQWREASTRNEWTVDGIIVERAKGKKGQKKAKAIVLTDGPAGIEWGNGNLFGNFEDGCLVWRNRRGEATYSWQKLEGEVEPMTAGPVAKDAAMPALPFAVKRPSKEDLSPRSTNSGTSNETAAMTAESLAMSLSQFQPKEDEVAFAEVKMLLEMARSRLMAGDVYTSMRYITLAQQVQPLVSTF
jgi:hypothetical protein